MRCPDGAIRITDRLKEVIKVAVVGKPDARWGEVPLAIVVLKPGDEASDKTPVGKTDKAGPPQAVHRLTPVGRCIVPGPALMLSLVIMK